MREEDVLQCDWLIFPPGKVFSILLYMISSIYTLILFDVWVLGFVRYGRLVFNGNLRNSGIFGHLESLVALSIFWWTFVLIARWLYFGFM